MMPGVGFLGGRLSVIGGYSWPGGVELIEVFDEDTEEWVKRQVKIEQKNGDFLGFNSSPILGHSPYY